MSAPLENAIKSLSRSIDDQTRQMKKLTDAVERLSKAIPQTEQNASPGVIVNPPKSYFE